MSRILYKDNPKIQTYDDAKTNGSLIPILSIHDSSKLNGHFPEQVYLTTILPGQQKGPHLHKIRTGCFTCIKGDVKIITKENGKYEEFFSGESHSYRTILIPANVTALLVNVSSHEAFVLNMPCPAWHPDMDDEYTDDFSDCEFLD